MNRNRKIKKPLPSLLRISVIGLSLSATLVLCSSPLFSRAEVRDSPKKEPEENKIVPNNSRFGLRLFSELAKSSDSKNIFVSPSSVSMALTLAYIGSDGKTKEAMAKALEYQGMNMQQVNKANLDLLRQIESADPKVKVNIANAIWANASRPFSTDYQQKSETFYRAEVHNMPKLASEETVSAVNGWAKRKTEGKIDKVVSLNDLRGAMFILTNAVYFKGLWKDTFDKTKTRDGQFTLTDGTAKKLPMMTQTGSRYKMLHDQDFDALSIPYGSGRYSLYLFLPNEHSNLKAFLGQLNPENWQRWNEKFKEEKVNVLQLPRFKVEYEENLVKTLDKLGMGAALHSGADFRPMGLGNNIYIGVVKHKTTLDVDEEGTTATAVTVVVGRAGGPPQKQNNFIVNRPFFCAIRDNTTGTDLFLGAIYEPK